MVQYQGEFCNKENRFEAMFNIKLQVNIMTMNKKENTRENVIN